MDEYKRDAVETTTRLSPVSTAPTFTVPELASVGLDLSLADLRRHVLVLGGSGSGKTISVVVPVLEALVRYRQQCSSRNRPAILVIDPKDELSEVLAVRASRDRFTVQEVGVRGGQRLDYFARADRDTLMPGRVVDEILSLNPAGDYSAAQDPFWQQTARRYLAAGVAFHMALAACCKTAPGLGRNFWQSLQSELTTTCGLNRDDVRPLSESAPMLVMLRGLIRLLAEAPREKFENGQRAFRPRPSAMFGQLVRSQFPAIDPSGLESLGLAAVDTSSCIAATVETLLAPLSDADLLSRVRLDPLPPRDGEDVLNMNTLVKSGQLLLLRPDPSSLESRIAGRAYKASYFRSVLAGLAVTRGAAYVCDEAHLFLTDDETGEASFLDRARAFGGMCVLVTQSLASLQSAVRRDRQSVVPVIVANCAMRFQFSTVDATTIRELRDVLPPPPDLSMPHVTAVRPLPLLQAGECYWVRPGAFAVGRVQLKSDRSL